MQMNNITTLKNMVFLASKFDHKNLLKGVPL